jgi:hypothetical protein
LRLASQQQESALHSVLLASPVVLMLVHQAWRESASLELQQLLLVSQRQLWALVVSGSS